jgi:UDP-N-acetylbacillosamine N-acetyltransferase
MTPPTIYLLGLSGHALSVLEAMHSCGLEIAGYFDNAPNKKVSYPYVGREYNSEDLKKISSDAVLFPAVGSNAIRQRMVATIEENGFSQIIFIHQSAKVSKTAQLEDSVLVSMGAMIQSCAMVGKGSIINTGAIVEHECTIAPFSHIGPGTVLAGNVKVGTGSFIGANATVLPGITIGSNAIIGAGAVVTKDVPENAIFTGNPARLLRSND